MHNQPVFALEQYLLKYEHKAEISLCNSGLDPLTLSQLLAVCDSETRALWEQQMLGYSEPQGHPLLRAEIASLYECSNEVSDGAKQKLAPVLFAGASEAILCGLSALLSADDHCIVITPCYQSLKTVPQKLCETTTVSLQPEDGQWRLDLSAIREAIQPNTRAVVINFPHNPTGALPERAILDELVALARQYGLYLFSDEVYRGLEMPGVEPWPPLANVYERGISVGSLSKLYALPGVRTGWLACPDSAFLEAASGLKHFTSICNNTPGEILSLIALRARHALVPASKAALSSHFEQMEAFLNRHADLFEWIPPQAGCLIFPQLKRGMSAERFALDLLYTQKVLVLPGQVYDFPGEALRLSFAGRTLPQALQGVENFIGQMALVH